VNVLFIRSAQHNSEYLGFAGHRLSRTQHLDALAQRRRSELRADASLAERQRRRGYRPDLERLIAAG
jgi:hypothetical protein